MNIVINTDILHKKGLSVGEFLILLYAYLESDYKKDIGALIQRNLANVSVFNSSEIILSNKTKEYIAQILMQSDSKSINSKLNFEDLARKLQEIYPSGNKAGTTYSWRDTIDTIAQKLRTLVVLYNFSFTEEEALTAAKEYVNSFEDTKYMSLLKYFILRTTKDGEFNSMFMTIIENNRNNESNI